ncbi:hypothetical protein BEN47_05070 [Hymenobacter lapidarius]|uniref:BT4734-like N-terminal domain-containing protein n=1 Tax=Hymenobacter lapidarius TaxID=1908237 RepID=A0A1G1STP9_9BACT|nr:BT4734/BF3469 family protein [Hymenobacter lapidarius]OGX81993.1 hypothetical protein BEN47_05070 [Hymenobacter lapidarius]
MNSEPTEALHLPGLLADIRDGHWAEQVLAVRALDPTSAAYREAKKKLPSFTASGRFQRRIPTGLLEHSGFLCLDIDAKMNAGVDLAAARRKVEADPATYACFASAGGVGLCALVRIPADNHAGCFRSLRAHYKQTHGLVVDNLIDVSRLRFVSYDPALYLNEQARAFAESLPEPTEPNTTVFAVATILPTLN